MPAPATNYPSTIAVSGQSGTIDDLNVTVTGINGWNNDIGLLLVGPAGGSQNLVLLSDAGSGSISNVTLTLDDEAGGVLPQKGSWGTSPVTARPTDNLELAVMAPGGAALGV